MGVHAPRNLGSAGKKLWDSIAKDDKYELRPDEVATLEHACRTADWVDKLEEAQLEAPLLTRGSMGQDVISPYISELRQYRALLARLLAQLRLPDEAHGAGVDMSAAGRQMANRRWGNAAGA